MYSGPIKNHINANRCCLTPAMLEKAIVLAEMTWGMPPAQAYTTMTWGMPPAQAYTTMTWGMPPAQAYTTMTWPLINPAVITVSNEDSIKVEVPTTVLGLLIEIDKSLPCGTVQLRYQGAVLFEIQCLAVPWGFEEAA